MTSEEEDNEEDKNNGGGGHQFNNPNNFKFILESGGIPDAAMIHAARKSRQKARELGEYSLNGSANIHRIFNTRFVHPFRRLRAH